MTGASGTLRVAGPGHDEERTVRAGPVALVVVAAVALVAVVVVASGALRTQAPAAPDAPATDLDPGTSTDRDEAGPGDRYGPEVTASTEVAQPTLWLCGPEADDDACAGDLDATVVAEDGTRTVEPFVPARDAEVDCFYVYPTVSRSQELNAPLEVTEELRRVAHAQAARFGEVCRVVAPVHRQVTLAGILRGGLRDPAVNDVAYGDVLSAFNDHLATSGDRPFVLIGHSQGAQHLTRLVAERIEGDPDLRTRLVSALLLGGQVEVPAGEDVGESFLTVPACRATDQVGCVVAYNAYPDVPPAFGLFGRADGDRQVLCVNPAAPAGGEAPLTPYLPTDGADGFDTPFVTAEGAATAECRREGPFSWLEVRLEPDVAARTGELGAVQRGPAWGLHVGDVNLALGDLVDLVGSQIAALPDP